MRDEDFQLRIAHFILLKSFLTFLPLGTAINRGPLTKFPKWSGSKGSKGIPANKVSCLLFRLLSWNQTSQLYVTDCVGLVVTAINEWNIPIFFHYGSSTTIAGSDFWRHYRDSTSRNSDYIVVNGGDHKAECLCDSLVLVGSSHNRLGGVLGVYTIIRIDTDIG